LLSKEVLLHRCQVTFERSLEKEFNKSNKILQQRPWNEHAQGRLPLGQRGIIKSMLLEGGVAPSPWWWCLLVVCVVVD
jgi:hypothetical protein